MADREKSFGIEREQNFTQFGSQRRPSNSSQSSNLGSQQYNLSDNENNQINTTPQINGHKLVAGIRSAGQQSVQSNKYDPSKRMIG